MAHAPKKQEIVAQDTSLRKSDSEVAEKLFGKKAKQELDRLIDDVPKSMPKG